MNLIILTLFLFIKNTFGINNLATDASEALSKPGFTFFIESLWFSLSVVFSVGVVFSWYYFYLICKKDAKNRLKEQAE